MLQKTRTVLISGCFFFLALGALAMAQGMGGSQSGMMGGNRSIGGMAGGNSGMVSSTNMGGSGNMGSTAGMDGTAMEMSNGAVTVGIDGTLYVLSRVLPQSLQGALAPDQIKTKLSAIDGKRGITLWSIVFDESWLMRPVQGPDGHLFLVAFGDQVMGMLGSTATQDQNARFYVVDPGLAKVINSVELDGEVASLPTISGSGTTYTVYIESFDMGHNVATTGQFQGPHRDAVLTAFDHNGNVEYTLPLNQ